MACKVLKPKVILFKEADFLDEMVGVNLTPNEMEYHRLMDQAAFKEHFSEHGKQISGLGDQFRCIEARMLLKDNIKIVCHVAHYFNVVKGSLFCRYARQGVCKLFNQIL